MSRRSRLAWAAVAVAAIGLFATLFAHRQEEIQARTQPAAIESGRSTNVNQVVGSEPNNRNLSVNVIPARVPSSSSPILRGLLASSDLKQSLDQLQASTEIPAKERLFYEAVILQACERRDDAVARTPPDLLAAMRNGNIDELIAKASAVAKSDRQRSAIPMNLRGRLAYLCRNFSNRITDEEVERAFAAAAAAGNATAQARVVEKRMADSGIQNFSKLPGYLKDTIDKPGGFPDPITTSEQTQLIGALFSGDPIAIRQAGTVMSIGGDHQSLRIGPDQIDIGEHADETWTLVACQFGFECGTMNGTMNHACAQLAQCTDTYEDLLREYVLTPQEFDRIQRNVRLLVDAIRRRDLSAFTLVNVPGQVRTVIAVPGMVRIH